MNLKEDDRRAIMRAATDYLDSWLDGDASKMASCLHPALAKRAAADHDSGRLTLLEAPFIEMTTAAVEGGPKPLGRFREIEIQDADDDIATVSLLSEPFVDLLHLARFGDQWLIVNVLYQRRPGADATGDPAGAESAMNDYARMWFDRDVEAVRRSHHPDLKERKAFDHRSGSLDLEEISFEELLAIVAEGPDEPVERSWRARLLSCSRDIASAKVVVAWWDIYLHLARFGGTWMIVNILYRSTYPELRPQV